MLFALSSFEFITNFYSLPMFLSFIFLLLCFLMGVNFPTCTQFREAITFPFCIHIIFLVLSAPHHLLLFHDIFDCTTYVHRSGHHDILASTVIPFLGTSSYFCFHHVCSSFGTPRYFDCTALPFLMRHHIFVFITFVYRSARHGSLFPPRYPSFWSITIVLYFHELLLNSKGNTVVQRRDISSTVLKIKSPLSRPLQHGVKL